MLDTFRYRTCGELNRSNAGSDSGVAHGRAAERDLHPSPSGGNADATDAGTNNASASNDNGDANQYPAANGNP